MNILQTLRRWRRMLVAGVRMVLRLPQSIHPVEWTIQALSFPQHDWAKRLRRDLSRDEFEITWQQALNPVYWIAWTARFSIKWVATRPYTSLVPAIPAVTVAALLFATAFISYRKQGEEIQSIYLDTLRTSLASGETNVASVAAQRLLAIDPENLEHQYQLALLDAELGKAVEARGTILQLALEDEYGPAALWVLKTLIYEEEDSRPETSAKDGSSLPVRRREWDENEKAVCHRCATIAINRLPSARANFAKSMYAGFLADNGATGDALRLYASLAESDPSVNLVAANLAANSGDYLQAQSFAKDAIRYLDPQLLSDPTSARLRLEYAQALVLDEQDDRALKVLSDGMKIAPDPRFKVAAGETLIFKSYRMQRNVGSEETLLERAKLLIDALKLAPGSPLVVESVVQLAIECHEADNETLLRVRKALLKGMQPAAMHFVEGTVLLMAGDDEAAIHHLELAAKEGGNMAGLLNNLAVALGKSDEKHLPQALRFSNEALRQLPDHPYLLETRGQILLRMKRYKDAIADLEKALVDPAMRPLAHSGLAKAYEALGVKDLAKQHRELASRYQSSIDG